MAEMSNWRNGKKIELQISTCSKQVQFLAKHVIIYFGIILHLPSLTVTR